jgi:hypothetical protein
MLSPNVPQATIQHNTWTVAVLPLHTGTLELTERLDLAFFCAAMAACADLVAIAMAIAYTHGLGRTPAFGLTAAEVVSVLMFACNCWQHAMTCFVVLESAYQAKSWLAVVVAHDCNAGKAVTCSGSCGSDCSIACLKNDSQLAVVVDCC